MSVATAFFKRDLSLNLSYRTFFFLSSFSIIFSVASTYFMAKLFGSAMVSRLSQYGGDYFAFALIGVTFYGYLNTSLTNYAQGIREGQQMGTLEIMMLSPTRLSTILLSSSLWSYFFTTLNVAIYFIVGVFIFHFDLSHVNVITSLLVLVLSVTSFSGLGILSAAVVLVVKKGDPIAAFYSGVSSLLSGVYYPISVLPLPLVVLAKCIPLTYALDAMRLAMLKGYSIYQVRYDLLILLGFTCILTPISFFVFRLALKRAKKEGSLVHY
jgi:ABC-2 type transport system permease protein